MDIKNSSGEIMDQLSEIMFSRGAGIYALAFATFLIIFLSDKYKTLLLSSLFVIVAFQSYVAQDAGVVIARILYVSIIGFLFMILSTKNASYINPLSFADKQIFGLAMWFLPYMYIIIASVDRIERY